MFKFHRKSTNVNVNGQLLLALLNDRDGRPADTLNTLCLWSERHHNALRRANDRDGIAQLQVVETYFQHAIVLQQLVNDLEDTYAQMGDES